jgi:ankyrin repeat protein
MKHRSAPLAHLFALAALLVAAPVFAQGISSGDVNEWSAFAPRAPEPARMNTGDDRPFKAITHEGPWSVGRDLSFGPDEQRLLDLLQARDWAKALVHLKQQQPDLNQRDASGLTPLTLAARAGQLELVREMIKQGALLDKAGAQGMTPLGAAAFAGHDLIVQDLIRNGASVAVPGSTGQLPLHLACAGGQLRSIQMLLREGADWREMNRQGRNALEEAAYFGQIPAMQFLAKAGVSLQAVDEHGLNAVHAAALGGQKAALAWLMAQGVPVPSVLSQVLIDRPPDWPPR